MEGGKDRSNFPLLTFFTVSEWDCILLLKVILKTLSAMIQDRQIKIKSDFFRVIINAKGI